MTSFKVCTMCMTYNQSRYITDTMDGFCAQKTDFPFVCCIIDDASTDGEQKVITDYLDARFDATDSRDTDYAHILFAQNRDNPNCHFAVLLLKENHYRTGRTNLKFEYIREWSDSSDYFAICEGDDYWTDPLKLQKQADHLDSDPQCMLCCSDAGIESPANACPEKADYAVNCTVPASDMIEKGGSWICTCTCLYRTEVIDKFLELKCTRECHVGDFCWQILSVILGNAYFIAEVTGVYRFVAEGSWTQYTVGVDPQRRLPETESIINMLLGLDEFSDRRYHSSFAGFLRKYVHDKALPFCTDRKSYRLVRKYCGKAWSYLSPGQRLLFFLYRFRLVEIVLVRLKRLRNTHRQGNCNI